jgi:hypothetical protein
MGACLSEETINVNLDNSIEKRKSNKLDNGPDPNFPDMEEWEGERYKGVGIKRMKGYKCDLPINKLNEMREKFWTTKIEEDENWRIVQQICVFDEERANMTLGRYNFEVATDCINHIIGADGEHYYVPNYCINDPYFEKTLSLKDEEEKKLTLLLHDFSNDMSVTAQFSNHDTGKKIKKVFIEKTKMNEKEYKIRLFFSGMEIKDNDYIYQHKLDDNYKIQVMKLKL